MGGRGLVTTENCIPDVHSRSISKGFSIGNIVDEMRHSLQINFTPLRKVRDQLKIPDKQFKIGTFQDILRKYSRTIEAWQNVHLPLAKHRRPSYTACVMSLTFRGNCLVGRDLALTSPEAPGGLKSAGLLKPFLPGSNRASGGKRSIVPHLVP